MKKVLFFLLMVSMSTSVVAQKKVNQKKESKNLMEVNRAWAKAVTPEAFFSFISPEALLMSPDRGIARGHEGIGKVLGEFQSLPGFNISWEPHEAFVSKSGDLGYTIDRILVSFNDENGKKVELYEKGVTIWKKDDKGDWKMNVDIYNVDTTINSIY